MKSVSLLSGVVSAGAYIIALPMALSAQTTTRAEAPPSLSSVSVPYADLSDYIEDAHWSVVLGKALFWDQQAGSDGMACASCHFHAGADARTMNQLSPSLRHTEPSSGGQFNGTQRGVGGPNYQLEWDDFPLFKLEDPNDRHSRVLYDNDDVVSSSGAFRGQYTGNGPLTSLFDLCQPVGDPRFSYEGFTSRQVEPRNTPTVINAVFNFRNLWDGRANNKFNGVDGFGDRSPNARVYRDDLFGLAVRSISVENASLASQAVGPLNDDIEMACSGRGFPDVAEKLLPRRALAFQEVAHDDGVLGAYVHSSGDGLEYTYRELIELAFKDAWWRSSQMTPEGNPQIVQNFSLFWGLAIMAYESTLVSDDSPYDHWADGDNSALSSLQLEGLDIFMDKGKCVNCHEGPDFTGAGLDAFTSSPPSSSDNQIERMILGDGRVALYDSGFYNIGVRPTEEDVGVGGVDPWGNPLSFTRQWQESLVPFGPRPHDHFYVDPANFEEPLPASSILYWNAQFAADRNAVDGAFKTPGLRNVELTGPYFHNGGQATLEQVVKFYNRGGDRRPKPGDPNTDTTGFGPHPSNLDADIRSLNLSEREQRALVAFLKSLTDERVRYERAPFDHPELLVPNGHFASPHRGLDPSFADDDVIHIAAVGQNGRSEPLKPFEERLAGRPFTPIYHDMEIEPQGWSVTNSANLGHGPWERTVPSQGTYSYHPDPGSDGDGSGKAWVTDNHPLRDVDHGTTVLTTGDYDISGSRNPVLEYYRWVAITLALDDALVVEASEDHGSTWVELERVTDNGRQWLLARCNLRDYIAGGGSVMFRFTVSDDPNNSNTEVGIDGFHLFDSPSARSTNVISGPSGTNYNTLFSYEMLAGPGQASVLFGSMSRSPTVVPGIINLDIGNYFTQLWDLGGVVHGFDGMASVSLAIPTSFPAGEALHVQFATFGSTLSLPLDTSNTVATTVR